jgi:hypothetical protein
VSKPLVIEPEAEFDLSQAFDNCEHRREGLGQDFLLCFEPAIWIAELDFSASGRGAKQIYPRFSLTYRRGEDSFP